MFGSPRTWRYLAIPLRTVSERLEIVPAVIKTSSYRTKSDFLLRRHIGFSAAYTLVKVWAVQGHGREARDLQKETDSDEIVVEAYGR